MVQPLHRFQGVLLFLLQESKAWRSINDFSARCVHNSTSESSRLIRGEKSSYPCRVSNDREAPQERALFKHGHYLFLRYIQRLRDIRKRLLHGSGITLAPERMPTTRTPADPRSTARHLKSASIAPKAVPMAATFGVVPRTGIEVMNMITPECCFIMCRAAERAVMN